MTPRLKNFFVRLLRGFVDAADLARRTALDRHAPTVLADAGALRSLADGHQLNAIWPAVAVATDKDGPRDTKAAMRRQRCEPLKDAGTDSESSVSLKMEPSRVNRNQLYREARKAGYAEPVVLIGIRFPEIECRNAMMLARDDRADLPAGGLAGRRADHLVGPGQNYRRVMRAALQRQAECGIGPAGARVAETSGSLGYQRQQLSALLRGV